MSTFSIEKLTKSISTACKKRPISLEKIEKMVVDIETNLLQNYGSEIKSSLIGQLVLNELMDLDKVSYIRFSSVYRNFEDENSFVNEIDRIKNEGSIADKKQMELFPNDKKQTKRNGVNVNGSNKKN